MSEESKTLIGWKLRRARRREQHMRAIANQIHALTGIPRIEVKEMDLSQDGELTDVEEGE